MSSDEVVPANAVLFADLCDVLENIALQRKRKNRQEQERVLTNFVNNFRIKVANITVKKNSSFFPILRLLLPDKERERSAYNLKKSKLGLLLVKVLSLSKQSLDAQKLLNSQSVNSPESDFAGVAYFVLKNRMGQNSGSLTIGEINDILDKIAHAEVGNKGPILDEAFSYAIKTLSAEQMKWFIRIILKDLKLGIGVHRILAAFHPDAPDLFNSIGDLSKVCEELEDGDTRPLELGIQVFFAVSPMLSERLDVTRVADLPRGTYHIENKFDGERFQMHVENGVFEYFSRKGYRYSDSYGKSYDSGLLTPYLKDCFSPSVTSFVLDGEMMGWDKYRQCFGSKGMAFDVKKITDKSKFRPCFCAFDVLYYNGRSLVGPPEKGGMPLDERLKILENMFTDVPGVIQHSKTVVVKDNLHILNALNEAMESQEEGIVVKDTKSYYIANRRNAGWYKIKPEYTENTMNDLDLVIIGADEAENKKQGRAKSFLVACADKVAPDSPPHRWLCVGRVATGLSFEERESVCALLERRWVPSRQAPPPPHLVFNKETPDFWILPEHSVALEVRATELIRSTDFGTSHTLRFPRVIKIREDKPVNDVMTLDEFDNLVADKGSVIKLSTKRVNEDQINDVEIKIRKKRTAKTPQVAEQFRIKTTGDVKVKSKALLGKKIYILSDDEDCKKEDLIRIVESHGGKHVENLGSDTFCCVAGRSTFRVKNYIQNGDMDIITTAWLRSLPDSDTPCLLSPLDMLSMKKATRLLLSRDYDRFGDSYTEFIDEGTMKKCLKKMEKNEPEIYLTHQEMLDLDEELFDDRPYSYLRPCFLNFMGNNFLNELRAKMYGATLCAKDSNKLTHVVLPKDADIQQVKKIKTKVNAIIVSEEWLEACFEEGNFVAETYFLFR